MQIMGIYQLNKPWEQIFLDFFVPKLALLMDRAVFDNCLNVEKKTHTFVLMSLNL